VDRNQHLEGTELMATPTGFSTATYWHPGHAVCPKIADENPDATAQPVTVYVPTDKTGWAGVTCAGCGQSLVAA
jgi:hypothetical protein